MGFAAAAGATAGAATGAGGTGAGVSAAPALSSEGRGTVCRCEARLVVSHGRPDTAHALLSTGRTRRSCAAVIQTTAGGQVAADSTAPGAPRPCPQAHLHLHHHLLSFRLDAGAAARCAARCAARSWLAGRAAARRGGSCGSLLLGGGRLHLSRLGCCRGQRGGRGVAGRVRRRRRGGCRRRWVVPSVVGRGVVAPVVPAVPCSTSSGGETGGGGRGRGCDETGPGAEQGGDNAVWGPTVLDVT